jgi:hypothetical protein
MSDEERLDYFSVFNPMTLDSMVNEWLKNGSSSPRTVSEDVRKHTITLYRAQRAREKAEQERIEEDRERLEGIYDLIDFVDSGF